MVKLSPTTKGARYRDYQNISKGCLRPDGYIKCRYRGEQELQHRAVWMEHNGSIPTGMEVDHINGVKSDNRIENLQLLSVIEHRKKDCTKIKVRPIDLWCVEQLGLGYRAVQAVAGVFSNDLAYQYRKVEQGVLE